MAYTIPVPEFLLHARLVDQLPSRARDTQIRFAAGRVIVSGRLRKMGISIPFVVEFEPNASSPEETEAVLNWRVRSIRPFLARFLFRAGLHGFSFPRGSKNQPWCVRLSLEELLDQLPAWNRLPLGLRRGLRLQHWWMPSDGRGAFLVFRKETDALRPGLQNPRHRPAHVGHRRPANPRE